MTSMTMTSPLQRVYEKCGAHCWQECHVRNTDAGVWLWDVCGWLGWWCVMRAYPFTRRVHEDCDAYCWPKCHANESTNSKPMKTHGSRRGMRREQASRKTGIRAWLPDGRHRPLQKRLVGLEATRFVWRLTARESFQQSPGSPRQK